MVQSKETWLLFIKRHAKCYYIPRRSQALFICSLTKSSQELLGVSTVVPVFEHKEVKYFVQWHIARRQTQWSNRSWDPPCQVLGLQIQAHLLVDRFSSSLPENLQSTAPRKETYPVSSQAGSGRQKQSYFGEATGKTAKLPTCPVMPPSVLGNKAAPLLDKKVSLPTQWLFYQSWESKD